MIISLVLSRNGVSSVIVFFGGDFSLWLGRNGKAIFNRRHSNSAILWLRRLKIAFP